MTGAVAPGAAAARAGERAGTVAGPAELLRVQGLSIGSRQHRLVHDVSFTLHRGERVGLIGESGSGKSLTALALLGLLPDGVHASGSAVLSVADPGDDQRGVGLDLLGAGERRLARSRGRDVAMVFQEPMTALNPTQRVGRQVAEVLRVHRTVADRKAAAQRAVQLLAQVQLPDPERTARAYPHQLSGGQRQRVVLAMAMANEPALLLCDEPTTALDVTVQAQMLDLIGAAASAGDSALLFITHDLAVVASLCERVLVMYGGRVVESGPIAEVFRHPRHHYTAGLLAASDLSLSDERGRLRTIPGTVPAAGRFPDGCVFRTRCPRADDVCASPPQLVPSGSGHAACWHPHGQAPA